MIKGVLSVEVTLKESPDDKKEVPMRRSGGVILLAEQAPSAVNEHVTF
jgi:hypothetical protein